MTLTADSDIEVGSDDIEITDDDIIDIPAVKRAAAQEKEKAAKPATFAQLIAKPKRKRTFTVNLVDEDGEPVEHTLVFQAISAKAYDELVASHPPTTKQRNEGASYNYLNFNPAILAAVSYEPKLTEAQARELLENEAWAGGETTALLNNALAVCLTGLDVPFNEPG